MQFCGVGWCCCDDLRTTVEAAAMVVMELAEVLGFGVHRCLYSSECVVAVLRDA